MWCLSLLSSVLPFTGTTLKDAQGCPAPALWQLHVRDQGSTERQSPGPTAPEQESNCLAASPPVSATSRGCERMPRETKRRAGSCAALSDHPLGNTPCPHQSSGPSVTATNALSPRKHISMASIQGGTRLCYTWKHKEKCHGCVVAAVTASSHKQIEFCWDS